MDNIDVVYSRNLLELLPNEVLDFILKYSSTEDLKSICLVDKRANSIARKHLWKNPKLKQFAVDEFKLIMKMPQHVLDLSGLVPVPGLITGQSLTSSKRYHLPSQMIPIQRLVPGPMTGESLTWNAGYHLPSQRIPIQRLFYLISNMDHLKHLKINRNMVKVHKQKWSMIIRKCQLKTLSLLNRSDWDHRKSLEDLQIFLQDHLSYFKFLKTLHMGETGDFDLYNYQQSLFDVSKIKMLSIVVSNIESDRSVNLFQILDHFTGLERLDIHLLGPPRTPKDPQEVQDALEHLKAFMTAFKDFRKRHWQCQCFFHCG